MKKLLLTGIISLLFFGSCSSVKNTTTTEGGKENHKEFMMLKGDWNIVSIDYDKSLRIKPFDEGADASCFIGSHWRLIPNNYSGAYTLEGKGNCPSKIQPIKFESVDGNSFQFKKIYDGEKAKQNVMGYKLTLLNQNIDQFSLQQDIPFEGEKVSVVYNFERTGVK